MSSDSRLARLLEHPAVWRGRSAAAGLAWPTGHATLDAGLPGGGWPRAGLVEILVPRPGIGELTLLMPLLARLTALAPPRWIAWIAPPFQPFAPALSARGVALDRQLIVRSDIPLWVMEQALVSGACEAVLGWARRPRPQSLRRLQLATGKGRTPAFLFRGLEATREASPAMLRLVVDAAPGGLSVALIKSRGGAREPVFVPLEAVA